MGGGDLLFGRGDTRRRAGAVRGGSFLLYLAGRSGKRATGRFPADGDRRYSAVGMGRTYTLRLLDKVPGLKFATLLHMTAFTSERGQ
jgi:hypothetical protein